MLGHGMHFCSFPSSLLLLCSEARQPRSERASAGRACLPQPASRETRLVTRLELELTALAGPGCTVQRSFGHKRYLHKYMQGRLRATAAIPASSSSVLTQL